MPRQPSAGPIVLPADVEHAVKATLQAWVPHYLADIDEQQGRDRGTTAAPRTYDCASDNDKRWLEEVPPAVLIACPGTIDTPERHRDDAAYGAWWQINIAVTGAGATEQGARDIAGRLGGALVYTLAQQADMGGLCKAADWLGMNVDLIGRERSVAACEVLGKLYVSHVVSTRGLLPRDIPTPVIDPATPLADITGVRVTTTRR